MQKSKIEKSYNFVRTNAKIQPKNSLRGHQDDIDANFDLMHDDMDKYSCDEDHKHRECDQIYNFDSDCSGSQNDVHDTSIVNTPPSFSLEFDRVEGVSVNRQI